MAYAAYLLQQRPDRVAVCGLYVAKSRFSLILIDAAGAYSTALPWDDESARNLLLRVVYYINVPPMSMIDPTVTRHEDAFTVNVQGQVLEGYTLRSCGHPLGRRTVVFQCEGANHLVVKEQYLRCPPEISEHTILTHIHEPGEMPGVVRVRSCEVVRRVDGSSIECGKGSQRRQKVRLLLQDTGTPFMAISTPHEALVTAWDVLEGEWCYLICKSWLMCQN